MEFTTKDIVEYLLSGAVELLIAFKPLIIPLVIGFFVWLVVKIIVRKTVYWHSILSGCSKKETKKRMKTADNAADLISAVNDIKKK